MTDKYAAMLTLQRDAIEVLGQTMPITIVRKWEVSIRPCEFNNFARLLGVALDVRTNSAEYHNLMRRRTAISGSLLDLVEMPDDKYVQVRATGMGDVAKMEIFSIYRQGASRAEAGARIALRDPLSVAPRAKAHTRLLAASRRRLDFN